MSTFHDSSQSDRPRPSARQPGVVVRAGKTFLCTACGTLVEVPADVVGRLVMAPQPTGSESSDGQPPVEHSAEADMPREEPCQAEVPVEENVSGKQPAAAGRPDTSFTPVDDKPPCSGWKKSGPRRPKRPARTRCADEMIDGLRVPTAVQWDRALAWVSFHLKVLDCQGTERHRLLKLLKTRRRRERRTPGTCDYREDRLASAPRESARREPASRQSSSYAPQQCATGLPLPSQTVRGQRSRSRPGQRAARAKPPTNTRCRKARPAERRRARSPRATKPGRGPP